MITNDNDINIMMIIIMMISESYKKYGKLTNDVNKQRDESTKRISSSISSKAPYDDAVLVIFTLITITYVPPA